MQEARAQRCSPRSVRRPRRGTRRPPVGGDRRGPGLHAIYKAFGSDGGIEDLNDLLPPGTQWDLLHAIDINDQGQIIGDGIVGGVGSRVFLLTPIVMGLTGPTPGLAGQPNTFVVENATPLATVYFFYAAAGGETLLPGCVESLDLASPVLLGTATANGAGTARLTVTFPGSASQQTVLFQAVEPTACLVSNVQQHQCP